MQHVERMFSKVTSRVDVQFVSGQPYSSAEEMKQQTKEEGVLQISKDHNAHPLYTSEQNLKFRAVHDYIVHILANKSFSDKGEVGAYNAHVKMVPPAGVPALFTEVVGQACYANTRGHFPSQKIAILNGFDYYHVGKVEGWLIRNKELTQDEDFKK